MTNFGAGMLVGLILFILVTIVSVKPWQKAKDALRSQDGK